MDPILDDLIMDLDRLLEGHDCPICERLLSEHTDEEGLHCCGEYLRSLPGEMKR